MVVLRYNALYFWVKFEITQTTIFLWFPKSKQKVPETKSVLRQDSNFDYQDKRTKQNTQGWIWKKRKEKILKRRIITFWTNIMKTVLFHAIICNTSWFLSWDFIHTENTRFFMGYGLILCSELKRNIWLKWNCEKQPFSFIKQPKLVKNECCRRRGEPPPPK